MTATAEVQATVLAGTVVKATRYAMLTSDDENLRDIISNISSQPGVEHVRIFNKKGLIEFSSDQAEIKRFVDKKGCRMHRLPFRPDPFHHPRGNAASPTVHQCERHGSHCHYCPDEQRAGLL